MNNIEIKVMNDKPKLTDDEIRGHMDFDKLLQLSKTAGAGVASTTSKWITVTAYVIPSVTVVTSVLYLAFSQTGSDGQSNPNQISVQSKDSVIHEPSAVKSIVEVPSEKIATELSLDPKQPNGVKEPEVQKPIIAKFTEAEPIDGYPALYDYFSRELKYPTEMARDSIEGVVTVSFAINELSKPGDIKIANSLGEAFDKECFRIIENMPLWRAATINGQATAVRLSIPLTFQIKKN